MLRPGQYGPGGGVRPGPPRSAVPGVFRAPGCTAARTNEPVRADVGRRLDVVGRDPGEDLGRRFRLPRLLPRAVGAGPRGPAVRPFAALARGGAGRGTRLKAS